MAWAKAGDVFFSRSNSLLGKLIRWGEQECDDPYPSWTNHTGVVVADGWIGERCTYDQAIVVEALWHVRKGPLDGKSLYRVFRLKDPLTAEELWRFLGEADSFVGDKYGWWKLLGFLVTKATCGKINLPKYFFIKRRPICSFLAAWVFEMARPGRFGVEPQAGEPDDMMDYCIAHPEIWEEVK